MKKLIFVFFILFVLVLVTGCNARRNTVHFNPKVDETAEMDIDAGSSEDVAEDSADETEVDMGPDFDVNSLDLEGDKMNTNVSYHVISGTTPANTAKVKVNDYTLQRYQAGQTEWSYIASTGIDTLKEGENKFKITALDAKDNEIGSKEFTITYEAPEIPELPSVGSNEWMALIISILISATYFAIRRLRKVYIKNI